MRHAYLIFFLFLSLFLGNQLFANNLPPCMYINKEFPREKLLSLYFQDIDIRILLQLIAKSSGMNFIVSDAVKGNTTLNLKNVTWQQALSVVMRSHGLSARRCGNVLYISTMDEITGFEAKKLQSIQEISNLVPVETRLIQLKYANAEDLEEFLKGQRGTLLTPRGQVSVYLRTNSLIIRDIRSNLDEIIRAISRLDVPSKQVLIESRIVTIDTNYEEQLGIKFGTTIPRHLSGTFSGANQLARGVPPPFVIPPEQRLNFNNPASQLTTGAIPGTIGLALARLGNVLLDLELSAIEAEGHGKIIASPHVITSNQQRAMIKSGEEIPYQEATSSGATNIAFKNAVLSLEIIPQITPDNKIILHLKATEDTRGEQLVVSPGTPATPTSAATPPVLGPPIINSHEVESHILLNNNETIVVGGIFKQTRTDTVDRIPFFGSLPVVGFLFRHKGILNQREELLIFITTKILNSNCAVVNPPPPEPPPPAPCPCLKNRYIGRTKCYQTCQK